MITRRTLFGATAATALTVPLGACGTVVRTGPVRQDPSGPLRVWFPGGTRPEIDLVEGQIVPAFGRRHGVEVEVTYVDWDEISPKLAAAMAANTAPDVFGHGPAATAEYAAAGRVLPLDAFIRDWSDAERRDLATFLGGGRYQGRQYMIPLAAGGSLLAYRTDLFDKFGLRAPPRTWPEVREAARRLVVRGGPNRRAGILLPTAAIGRSQTFTSLLLAAGGSLLDASGTRARFHQRPGVRALTFFVSLYRGAHPVADQLGADHNALAPGQRPLATGATAMEFLGSTTLLPILQARPELAESIDVVLPKFRDRRAFGGGDSGLFINRDSAKHQLAWKFIQTMVSSEVSQRYADATGAVPLRASAKPTGSPARRRLLSAYIDAGPSYRPNPNIPRWVQVRDILDRYLEQALLGRSTPTEALERAAAEVDGVLAGDR